jgi:hypothetical protein
VVFLDSKAGELRSRLAAFRMSLYMSNRLKFEVRKIVNVLNAYLEDEFYGINTLLRLVSAKSHASTV